MPGRGRDASGRSGRRVPAQRADDHEGHREREEEEARPERVVEKGSLEVEDQD